MNDSPLTPDELARLRERVSYYRPDSTVHCDVTRRELAALLRMVDAQRWPAKPTNEAPLTPAELDELRKLFDKATPGPWLYGYSDGSGRVDREYDKGGSILGGGENGVKQVVVGGRDSWGCEVGVLTDDDAELIVAARNTMPKLLKRLGEALDALMCLRDVQNGPPLPSYEREWKAAMAKADGALGYVTPPPAEAGEDEGSKEL